MYFKFIGFYTMMLIIPSILGILSVVYSFETPMKITFFAVFNLVWATFFLEFWKRKCSVLSFKWGTLTCSIDHEVQPHYCGKGRHNIIINRYTQDYPLWKVSLKVLLSTIVVVIGAAFAMWLAVYEEEIICNITFTVAEEFRKPILEWTDLFRNGTNTFIFQHENDFEIIFQYISITVDHFLQIKLWLLNIIQFPIIQLYIYSAFQVVKEFFFEHFFDFKISTAIYATIVWVLNHLYAALAFKLTKWENHQLQGDFDWHHISKIVILEFINNFSSLFYIAFYLQDMENLKSQVSTMLIIKQIINQFEETIFPYMYKKIRKLISKKIQNNDEVKENQNCDIKKSPMITQTEKEADLECIQDAVEDYLEMFIQFGYVSLFSSAFPLAAFWAFLNNIIEIKSDAFKFCNLYKRPRVKRVRSIGVWQSAFELLGVIGVATNCALLCMSPSLQSYSTNWSPVHWVLLFVALEHMTLGVKAAVMYIVDDQPRWVREKLEENNCKSRHDVRERMISNLIHASVKEL
ncbi:unnamed protein product [Meganyctiphanes norvegica]|uniref:Anoctamin n=1 Tax=Meganyctiphanes norvegica TaxID=48144 RepID=A0AAV2R7W2_MEGNR